MPTVDNLDIEISASVSKANASLDLLVKRLGKVSASLSGVNTRGIATMASGVNKLANAMNNFSNNTNTAVFTRLTRNLNSLGNIDQNAIANASKSLGKIAGAMKVFNNINVSDNARQLGDLARGISQLGYKSSTQAIQNIPQLATAMRNLMQTLSTAPRVSQNLIDMTNALGRLARTGASSGRAATSLGKSLGFFSKSTVGARRSSLSLASAIGKLYATYWLLFRAFGKIGQTIDIASGLQEVQNVVDVTFGDFKQKVEDLAKVSITDFGMSELTAKQIAGRFQAMGTAMGIAQGKMSDMSIELTKLSADMASFYNVAQEDVARSLQSVFTGEAEPLRKYGVDLTQATLKTFALSQGLNSNVEAMTQAEKTMLRYQYVMHATGAAQGDFARTSNNWANQIRILKGNFQELAGIIGTSFINALKPLVQALNSAMRAIINFAKVVSNSLGKIFGWQYEETGGGVTADMESASDYADDLASGTGKAADNAKKLKQQLQGIDELNVLTTPSDTGGSGGSGGGAGGGATDSGNTGGWTKTDGLLKDYESQLDTLYKLGEEIGNKLTKAMNSIDWNSVYEGARNFGSGLASFLNGLISPELFGATGRTIAGALNTAIYTALSFGEEFDFSDFGLSVAAGINEFFDTFDFSALAKTLNTWVDGLKTSLKTALEDLDVESIIKGLFEFVDGLELDTIALILGAFAWKYKGQQIALSALNSLLAKDVATGIGTLTVKVPVAVSLLVAAAYGGFKLGEHLYETVPTIQQWSDAIVEWLFDGGTEINVGKAITIGLTGLTFSLGTAGIVSAIKTAITGAITTASAEASLAGTGVGAVLLGKIGATISGATTAIAGLATTIGTTIAGAIATIAPIAAQVGIVVAVAIAGYKIGEIIYEKLTGESAQGGLKDLIDMDASLSEIGQAISDGAVVDITLTPLLKWLSGDDSITTQEVIDAGALMIEDIVSGLEKAGNAVIEFGLSIGETAQEFYTNHIKPLLDGVKEKLVAKFTVTMQSFSEIQQKVEEFVGKVKEKLKDKFDVSIPTWSDVKTKVTTLVSEIKNKLSAKFGISIPTWSDVKKKITDLVKKVKNKLSASFKIKLPHIKLTFGKTAGKTLADKAWNQMFGGKPKFSVAYYANGGFPEDGWFRASRGEIMGRFDNGQSVVANNMQITQGISDAVQRGNQENNALMRQEITILQRQNELLMGILEKETGISYKDVGRASQKFAREYSNRTGKPAFI